MFRRKHVSGRRFAAGFVALALAFMMIGLGTNGVGAASQTQPCPDPSAAAGGQTQGGSTQGGAGTQAQGNGEPTFCVAGTGLGTDSAAAPGAPVQADASGVVCSITLPDGAAPGSTVVVTLPNAATGGAATGCAISVVSSVSVEGSAGVPSTSAQQGGVPACTAGSAGTTNGTTDASGAAGASTSQNGAVDGTQAGACEAISIAPGQGVGGFSVATAPNLADGAQSCVLKIEQGAAAGGASVVTSTDAGEQGVGQVVTCADATTAPNAGSAPAATTSTSAGETFVCTVADAANPGTLVCTAQP